MLRKCFVGLILFVIFFVFNSSSIVFARSGCCSHHGGVCGCGCCDGTSLSAKCAPYYPNCGGSSHSVITKTPTKTVPISTPKPTNTPRPTAIPAYTKAPTPTPKLTKTFISCSDVKDNQCPNQCGLGNDIDCCNNNSNYHWIKNAGCYPKQLSCSATPDGKCDWYCTAGNDADCCEQKLDNYTWYENYGCYPKQEAQCSGIADGICPSNCDNGWDADCCELNLTGYKWYENWGCYEK